MAPFDELGTLALGLLVPAAGFFLLASAVRAGRRAPPEMSRPVEEWAAQLGLTPTPLEGTELAGLVGGGLLGSETRVSATVRWEAPDATFTAFVARQGRGLEGIVIVTPRGSAGGKPRLADIARRVPRDLLPVGLPGDLGTTAPNVRATWIGNRLVVRRPDVSGGEALERLVMCACAILDG